MALQFKGLAVICGQSHSVHMLDYDFPLWRPPSEGQNLIVQATLGCSFNGCTFCSMYKDKTYQARPLADVFADIDRAAEAWPDAHRVFLADGDAMTLPEDHMMEILDKLAATFPDLQRVSCYATPRDLAKKGPDVLARLKERKLNLVYLGIESGSGEVLKRIRKGSRKGMETALAAAHDAGLKVSATVILGVGGRGLARAHVAETAELINRHPPTFLSTLQLGLEAHVEQSFMDAFGDFEWQDDAGILAELAALIAALAPPRPVIFRSNHASNCLPLAGTLPKDKGRLLAEIEAAKAGKMALRPRNARRL